MDYFSQILATFFPAQRLGDTIRKEERKAERETFKLLIHFDRTKRERKLSLRTRPYFVGLSISVVQLVFGCSHFRSSYLGRFRRFPSSECSRINENQMSWGTWLLFEFSAEYLLAWQFGTLHRSAVSFRRAAVLRVLSQELSQMGGDRAHLLQARPLRRFSQTCDDVFSRVHMKYFKVLQANNDFWGNVG